jgi:hypothetical protein
MLEGSGYVRLVHRDAPSITECVVSVSRKTLWLASIIGLLAVVHFGLELAVTVLSYVEEN